MSPRPIVLFYCQHALGMGHFVRSIALAERLSEDFEVVFLNGGALPAGVSFPARVERIDLPALGMTEEGSLVSLDAGYSVSTALVARRDRMLELLEQRRPDLLLVELFPFGRKKFESELVPLLEAARQQREPAPLVACSVRDLLVTGRAEQQRFDDRAQQLCDRYFDLVLVHADVAIASFDESFRPSERLRTPVYHTGFLSRRESSSPSGTREGVVVSAGGGLVGEPLFRAAVEAHRLRWPLAPMPTTIVAGPFAPAATLDWLRDAVAKTPDLRLIPHVPDLRPLLKHAALSISQCGYNTALDIVSSGVPALVVPFGDDGENEQSRRAERLAAGGLLRWLPAPMLSGETLARAIAAMHDFTPAARGLCMDGANETAHILRGAIHRREAVGTGGPL